MPYKNYENISYLINSLPELTQEIITLKQKFKILTDTWYQKNIKDDIIDNAHLKNGAVSYTKLDNKALATTHEFSLGRTDWKDYVSPIDTNNNDNNKIVWVEAEKANQLDYPQGVWGRSLQFKQHFSLPLNKKMKFIVLAKCIGNDNKNNKDKPTLELQVDLRDEKDKYIGALPIKQSKFNSSEIKTVELEFEINKDGMATNNTPFAEASYFDLKIIAGQKGKFLLYSAILQDVVETNDIASNAVTEPKIDSTMWATEQQAKNINLDKKIISPKTLNQTIKDIKASVGKRNIINIWDFQNTQELSPGYEYAIYLDSTNTPMTVKILDGKKDGDKILIHLTVMKSTVHIVGSDGKKPSQNTKIHHRYRAGTANFPDNLADFVEGTIIEGKWEASGTPQWYFRVLLNVLNADESTIEKFWRGAKQFFRLKNGGVTTLKIASKAVTTAKIDDDAVTTAKIDDDAVATANIQREAVTGEKIDKGNGITQDSSGRYLQADFATVDEVQAGTAKNKVISPATASFAVAVDDLTIEKSGGKLALKNGGIITEKIAPKAVSLVKLNDDVYATEAEAKDNTNTTKLLTPKTHYDVLIDILNSYVFGDYPSLPEKTIYKLYTSYLYTSQTYDSIDKINTELTRVKNLLSNTQVVNNNQALNGLKNVTEGDLAFVKVDSNHNNGWAFYWYSSGWKVIQTQHKAAIVLPDSSVSYKKLDNKVLATTHEFSLGRTSWKDYVSPVDGDNNVFTWNTSEKANQLNHAPGKWGRSLQFKQHFSLPLNKKMKFIVLAKCIADDNTGGKLKPKIQLQVDLRKDNDSYGGALPTKIVEFNLNEVKTVELEFEIDKDGKSSNNTPFADASYFDLKIIAGELGKFLLYSAILQDVVEENDLSDNIKQLLTNNSPAHEKPHYDWHRHIWEEDHGDLIFRGKNYFTKYNFYTLPNNWDTNKTVEITEGFNDGYVTGQNVTLELVFYFNSKKFNNANLITVSGKDYLNITGSGNSVGIVATKHKLGDVGYVIENMIELKTVTVGNWFICRVAVEITDYIVGSSYTFRLINNSSKSGVTTQNILKDDFALSIVQYAGINLKVTKIGLSYEKLLHKSDVVSDYKSAKSKDDKLIPSSIYSIKDLHDHLYSTVVTAGGFASGDRKSAGEYQITMSANTELFHNTWNTFSNLVNGIDTNYSTSPPDVNKIYFSTIAVAGKNITFDFTNANALKNGVLKDYDIVFKSIKLSGSSGISVGNWKFQTGDEKGVFVDTAHTNETLTLNTKISFGNGLTPTRKLRMVGVSGNVSSSPWLGEFFFEYYLKSNI